NTSVQPLSRFCRGGSWRGYQDPALAKIDLLNYEQASLLELLFLPAEQSGDQPAGKVDECRSESFKEPDAYEHYAAVEGKFALSDKLANDAGQTEQISFLQPVRCDDVVNDGGWDEPRRFSRQADAAVEIAVLVPPLVRRLKHTNFDGQTPLHQPVAGA